MSANLPPLRSHLYAPGNNARLLAKVFSAGADAVVLDLEDAVPPSEKIRARELVAETLRQRSGKIETITFVRINHPSSGLAEDDIRAVVQPGLSGLRLPKVEDAGMVRQVSDWVEKAEGANGLPVGSVVFICTIESAVGVFRAYEIATAHPRVMALGFGAADLARDLGIIPGPEGHETLYALSQLVIASRVAGLRPPIDSVYRYLDDSTGLEKSARQAKALGLFGKSAIHPKQVPIINAVFTPTEAEIVDARKIVALAQETETQGKGAVQNSRGEFIDVAVVRRAQGILTLAESLAKKAGG
ncbi:(S)-citramalyl-CoA lyase [Anaerolineae bacterium]|nr:(S)-citramalyl-CoA lyase [Anaerolineae bacterium]